MIDCEVVNETGRVLTDGGELIQQAFEFSIHGNKKRTASRLAALMRYRCED